MSSHIEGLNILEQLAESERLQVEIKQKLGGLGYE